MLAVARPTLCFIPGIAAVMKSEEHAACVGRMSGNTGI
jgi:hypothetical protein